MLYDLFSRICPIPGTIRNQEKPRPIYVIILKYTTLVLIIAGLIFSIILLSYGSSIVDSFIAPYKKIQMDTINGTLTEETLKPKETPTGETPTGETPTPKETLRKKMYKRPEGHDESMYQISTAPSINQLFPSEIDCIKKVWTVFLVMNIVFSIFGALGIIFEQICSLFMFTIYAFFVTFGAFFDTVSKNQITLAYTVPVTLLSLILVAILRIERLDPMPEPRRKFSCVSMSDKA